MYVNVLPSNVWDRMPMNDLRLPACLWSSTVSLLRQVPLFVFFATFIADQWELLSWAALPLKDKRSKKGPLRMCIYISYYNIYIYIYHIVIYTVYIYMLYYIIIYIYIYIILIYIYIYILLDYIYTYYIILYYIIYIYILYYYILYSIYYIYYII